MITALSVNRGGLGRFGNQCFTIAGVIGIAIKSGQPYGFPKWINRDNEMFGGMADDMNDYFVNPLPSSDGISFQDYGYFWGYRDINLPTGSWNIDAHMQSDKFTRHCMGVIREQFRMKDEPEQNDYVAIHYRAGDYIDNPKAQHPRCSREYYENAMFQFPEGTKFLVFSDDIAAAYSMLKFYGSNLEFYDRPNYIEAFKLMKRCKHFITANSSYSSFAALLADHQEKKVIQPARWFGSQMPAEFDTKDLYHENAIII